jgi:hypothetical protein
MRDLEYNVKANDKSSSVFAVIEARAKAFNGELGGIGKSIDVAGAAAKAFAGAFTLSAVAGFGQYVRGVIKDVADMVDLADKVGISVENLQRLTYGLEQSGVAAEDVDQILTQWSKRIGDAYTHGGRLAAIFKANGVALTDSEGHLRSSVDLMRSYADLVANAGSDQERTTLSTIAFGKAGAIMVLSLRDGAKGFDELMRSIDDAGGALDDKVARRAADIDDRFGKMWQHFATESENAILIAAGALDDLNDKMTSMGGANLGMLLFKGMSMSALGGTDVTSLWKTVDEIKREFSDAVIAKSGRPPDTSPIGQRISSAFDVTAADDSRADSDAALLRRIKDLYGHHTIIPDDTSARKASTDAAKDQTSAYEKVIKSLDDERAMLGLDETEQRILTEQRKAGVTASSAEGQAIANTVRWIEKQKDAYEAAAKAMQDSASLGKDVFGGVISDLREGTSGAEIFANALGKIEDKLLDMELDNLFMGADGKGSGPLGSLFSGLLGIVSGGATGGSGDPWVGLRSASAARVAGNGGALPKSTIVINNNARARVTHEETTDSAGNRQTMFVIDDEIAGAIARPGSQSGKAIQGKYGVRNQLVRR